jgi:outer membrane protein assembly factor BamE
MRKHLVLISALFLSACSLERLPGVYRLDIHQGNIVTQEMVDQLKPGLTKRQVAFIMGTPLLRDMFHSERWDYVYSNQPSGEDRLQKTLSLEFDGDELIGVQGDFRPGEAPAEVNKDVTVNIPKIEREKTLWESISGIFRSGN